MSQLNRLTQKEAKRSKFPLPLPFFFSYFILSEGCEKLDESHSHWGGQSTSLNPLIQMLISSRNTLTGARQNSI